MSRDDFNQTPTDEWDSQATSPRVKPRWKGSALDYLRERRCASRTGRHTDQNEGWPTREQHLETQIARQNETCIDLRSTLRLRNREFDQLIRDNRALAQEVETSRLLSTLVERLEGLAAPKQQTKPSPEGPTPEPTPSPPGAAVPQSPPISTQTPARHSSAKAQARERSVLSKLRGWFARNEDLSARKELLANTPLFDPVWYAETYNDIGQMDAGTHYLLHGAKEGRNPHPLFDHEWYAGQTDAFLTDGISPLEHYLAKGHEQGLTPHPLFDHDWYAEQNPDVAEAGVPLAEHYLFSGWREGRSPHPLFDMQHYLKIFPHLQADGIEPLSHYLDEAPRNTSTSPRFDADWYLETYKDVAESDVMPLLHYARAGAREGRLSAHGKPQKDHSKATTSSPPPKGRASPLPDLFDLRASQPTAECLVVVQLSVREDASCASAFLRNLECDFDLVALAAPHLLLELEEYFGHRHRKTITVLESFDGPTDGQLFLHLINNKICNKYRVTGWISDPAAIPRPFGRFDPFAKLDADPPFGILSGLTSPLSDSLSCTPIKRLLTNYMGRLGSEIPDESTAIPGGPMIWSRSFLLRYLVGAYMKPSDIAFSLPGERPNQTIGGRDVVACMLGAAAKESALIVKESYA